MCPSPQGKLQKHQAFEAEVQANSGAIVKLDETGNLMISESHFASETIRVRDSIQITDSSNLTPGNVTDQMFVHLSFVFLCIDL